MATMEQAIKRSLGMRSTLYKNIEPSLLSSLAVLAERHVLDGKGLAAAFDKFMTVSRQDSTAVTAADVNAFAAEHGKAVAVAKAPADNLFARKMIFDDDAAPIQEDPAAAPSQRLTPYLVKSAAKRPVTPASGKFGEREHSGAVHAVLNPAIKQPDFAEAMEVDAAARQSVFQVLGQPMEAQARYMVNRIDDKAAYLEQRITALEREVEALCIEGAPHPVATSAQQETYFVGRVCCDTEDGRLNPQSVLLEGSIKLSQGSRVRLDLSKCPEFRLFPGQVVAVRGTNPSGLCVVAAHVLPGAPLPMARTPLPELVAMQAERAAGQSYVVAAGPFTTSEDLAYEPLDALLKYCAAHRPDVLLLLGPFVDAEHALVRGGLEDETFEEMFESRVAAPLAEFAAGPGAGTRVVLVPSTRDAHHDPVLPQPPLQVAPAAGVSALANPAVFSCDEVVVACSTADWLMACTKEEVSKAAGQVDRLSALASHLVTQQSLFPMFPPPLGTPLDVSKAAALALPCTPDILVVPSELAAFAKLLPVPAATLAAAGGAPASGQGNVVCINPGKLTKGATGGTFAHVYVGPHQEALGVAGGAPAATNGAVLHAVDSRCRVEVKKI